MADVHTINQAVPSINQAVQSLMDAVFRLSIGNRECIVAMPQTTQTTAPEGCVHQPIHVHGCVLVFGFPDPQTKPAKRTADPQTTPLATTDSTKPVPRWTAQEQSILDALRAAGHDPKALPGTPEGHAGIKKQIRRALVGRNGLFIDGASTFDKAWLRLRKQREIMDCLPSNHQYVSFF